MTAIECGQIIDPNKIDTSSAATDGIDVKGREDKQPMLYTRCPKAPRMLISLVPVGIMFTDLDGLANQQAKTKLLEVTQVCNKRNTQECPLGSK